MSSVLLHFNGKINKTLHLFSSHQKVFLFTPFTHRNTCENVSYNFHIFIMTTQRGKLVIMERRAELESLWPQPGIFFRGAPAASEASSATHHSVRKLVSCRDCELPTWLSRKRECFRISRKDGKSGANIFCRAWSLRLPRSVFLPQFNDSN